MKKIYQIFWITCGLLVTAGINAQSVINAEYFWDTDPGQGNGISMAASDGSLDESIEELFESNVNIPAMGMHTFNIRVKGSDGNWGTVFSYAINVTDQTLLTRSTNVLQAEYFWDTDPGLGNGNVILALDGNLDEALETLFDGNIALPSGNGLHKFGIRVKGVDNSWSSTFSYVVNLSDQSLNTRNVNVTQCEYFWDIDPGQGNGIVVMAFDGNLDEAIESVLSNSLIGTGTGVHVFNIRVKGVDNSWSSTFRHVVDVTYDDTYAIIDTSLCSGGGSYVVPSGDESYSFSGTYNDTIPNSIGMDSIITINLTFGNTTTSTLNPIACGSYVSPSGITYTTNGTYTDVIPNAAGCDSTITINLTFGTPTASSISPVECGSYLSPAGNTYTNSGTYSDVIPNAMGCDSTITINLTINNASVSSQTESECNSYVWPVNGNTYTSSGTYSHVLTNAVGCDSVITLNLIINTPNVAVTQAGSTLIANASGAVYQWVSCPSMSAISGATNQSFSPIVDGDYAVIVIDNGCSNTSSCFSVSGLSVKTEDLFASLKYFPNPTNEQLTILLADRVAFANVELLTLDGRLLKTFEVLNTDAISFKIEEPAGIYFVRLINGTSSTVLKITVN